MADLERLFLNIPMIALDKVSVCARETQREFVSERAATCKISSLPEGRACVNRRLVSRWHHDRRENRAENVTIGSVCIEALARRRESVIGVVGRTDAPARPKMRRVLLGEWCHRRPALRRMSVIR